jgi:hypothetical protein
MKERAGTRLLQRQRTLEELWLLQGMAYRTDWAYPRCDDGDRYKERFIDRCFHFLKLEALRRLTRSVWNNPFPYRILSFYRQKPDVLLELQ